MFKTLSYAAAHSYSSLKPTVIQRRDPKPNEVVIEVLYCGVCHSDIHQVKNEWKNTIYPCVPGHEIVGRVTAKGSKVKKHKVGDLVGLGPIVDSCQKCDSCKEGLEQYCEKGHIEAYNGNIRHPSVANRTYGGYSNYIVAREDYVLKIPKNLDPAAAAPILCAGVTVYSPLRHWNIGKGHKVGVIGLGGLGHMAVKIATALGAEVTLITTSKDKKKPAKQMGAKHVILSTDPKDMERNEKTLDFIISTIPATHDANPHLKLLKRDGVLVIVGCLIPLKSALDMSKIFIDRKTLTSSLCGSIAESQELLNFCAKHGIASDIKIIDIDEVEDAYDVLENGDADYRFVIDMSSLRKQKEEKGILAKIGLA